MPKHSMPCALACAVLLLLTAVGCSTIARMARGHPSWRELRRTPETLDLDGDRVTFRSSDDLNVVGWWLSAAGQPGRATVILVHGRGGNRGAMLEHARFLLAAGYDVLSIDMRAHGESEGDYPSGGYREAAEVTAAIRFARRRTDRPVVALGHSMGGVAVLFAASRGAPADAVIADSAFISTFDMMKRVRRMLVRDGELSGGARIGMWLAGLRGLTPIVTMSVRRASGEEIDPRKGDLLPVLPDISCPVLFVVGDQDEIAPLDNTLRMASAVEHPDSRVVSLSASHNTYIDDPRLYERVVLDFLDDVLEGS